MMQFDRQNSLNALNNGNSLIVLHYPDFFTSMIFFCRCEAATEKLSVCYHSDVRGALRLPLIFWTEIFWNRLMLQET